MNNVEHYSVMLCDALYMSMKSWHLQLHERAISTGVDVDYHIRKIDEINEQGVNQEYYLQEGRKYYKLICKDSNSRSVHCFINKTTGDVLKSASWNAPAKGVRYNLLDDNSRELCYNQCDPFGGYLYAR